MKVTIDYTWLGKVENEARQSPYPLKDITIQKMSIYLYMFRIEDEADFTEWMNRNYEWTSEISSVYH